jgi:hypothetical protein
MVNRLYHSVFHFNSTREILLEHQPHFLVSSRDTTLNLLAVNSIEQEDLLDIAAIRFQGK